MIRSYAALFACVLVVGCARLRGTSGSAAATAARPSGEGYSWVARAQPTVLTGTRIMGDVRITPSATKRGYSHVELDISGGAIMNRHPWTIASGNCTDVGPIDLGSRVDYPLIYLGGDGAQKMTVDLPFQVPPDQRYHVSVFASTADRQVVSCGELRLVG